jgi:DNA repair exonuclease SbcCD nuclease subunit
MSATVTIVHAADIHLDSPLRGLERLGSRELASRLRRASREALANLVAMTIETDAAALVLAGDIYDGDWGDYATGRYFVEQMSRLHDAGIQVVIVAGNHDAASVITRTLTLPDLVHVMSTDRPETLELEELGLAFHGQGFPHRAVVQNLATKYPEPITGLVNVGVLHTSVSGYDNHDPYAPCTVSDLQAKGYEYFALGHVHGAQVVCDGRTTAAFSGNLQVRHVKETGPKGAYRVMLSPGETAVLEFVELDVARWESLTVDVSQARDLDEVLPLVRDVLTAARMSAEGRPVVARLTLTGESSAARALADRARTETEIDIVAQRLDVALERIRNRTQIPKSSVGLSGADLDPLREIAARPAFGPEGVGELMTKITSDTAPVLRRLGLLESDSVEDPSVEALDILLARLSGSAR